MNSACAQLQFHECSLQNMIKHSKHQESFTEDTVIIEETVCCSFDYHTVYVICTYGKSSRRQEIGTAVNMENGGGQLQVHHSSIRDSTKIIDSGKDTGRVGYLFFLM